MISKIISKTTIRLVCNPEIPNIPIDIRLPVKINAVHVNVLFLVFLSTIYCL